MIEVLEQAIEKVRTLTVEQQEFAAEVLEQIASSDTVYHLSDTERALVREGIAELDRGEVASPADVRKVFDTYRL